MRGEVRRDEAVRKTPVPEKGACGCECVSVREFSSISVSVAMDDVLRVSRSADGLSAVATTSVPHPVTVVSVCVCVSMRHL